MAKLFYFAVISVIVFESYVRSEPIESTGTPGDTSSQTPLIRRKRQDEVDIITRRGDGRVVNEIDIITDEPRRRRTETVRRVVERRPTTVVRRPAEIDIVTRGRSGVREVDIIRNGRPGRREVDIITGNRRSGVREIDIIEGGRSGVREIDIVTGDRRSGRREIDIITGDRRTGTREIDIIEGGRSGVREIDIIERRRTTGSRTTSREHLRPPEYAGGVEEDYRAIDYKPMPYKFHYTAPNHKSIVERSEEADASGTVRGYYTMELGNGLYRYVDYIADDNGFRAAIRSNEPGIGGGANIDLKAELPPKDLTEYDLSERTDRRITTTTTTDTRRPTVTEVRRPSTVTTERRRTRTRGVTNIQGIRLVPITEEEAARRREVVVEEEIIEEPRTVIIEERRPETVIIEEVEQPTRVIVEERVTERRDRPRTVIRN